MGITQSKPSAFHEFRIPCELSRKDPEVHVLDFRNDPAVYVLDFRKVRSLDIQATAEHGKYLIIEIEGKKVAPLQSTLRIANFTKDLMVRVEALNRPDQSIPPESHSTVAKSARLSYVFLENPVEKSSFCLRNLWTKR